jgi:hypothetical protein
MPVRACLAGEKLPRLQADGFLVRGQVCLAHPDVLILHACTVSPGMRKTRRRWREEDFRSLLVTCPITVPVISTSRLERTTILPANRLDTRWHCLIPAQAARPDRQGWLLLSSVLGHRM